MAELTMEGFQKVLQEELNKGFEDQAILINRAFQEQKDYFDEKISKLDNEIKQLREDIKALSTKLTRYMELSDKRYLELKYRDAVVAKWIKQIADKTGVEIDLGELEKF